MVERERRFVFKELVVEVSDLLSQDCRKLDIVHRFPQRFDHRLEIWGSNLRLNSNSVKESLRISSTSSATMVNWPAPRRRISPITQQIRLESSCPRTSPQMEIERVSLEPINAPNLIVAQHRQRTRILAGLRNAQNARETSRKPEKPHERETV